MVGRWVTLERERRQAVREGRPDPREMEAEITALRRRVRELEKEFDIPHDLTYTVNKQYTR